MFRNKHIMIDLGTGNNNKMSASSIEPWSLFCMLTFRIETGQWMTNKR
jgi:hypothetical protein